MMSNTPFEMKLLIQTPKHIFTPMINDNNKLFMIVDYPALVMFIFEVHQSRGISTNTELQKRFLKIKKTVIGGYFYPK